MNYPSSALFQYRDSTILQGLQILSQIALAGLMHSGNSPASKPDNLSLLLGAHMMKGDHTQALVFAGRALD